MEVEQWSICFGGIYLIGFAVFHIYFSKIFKWPEKLHQLDFVNTAIMKLLNLSLIYVFLMFAFISFFFTDELINTKLGRALLIFISLFWLIRAIEQIIFFGLKNKLSFGLFIALLVGCFLYALPLILS